jgi:hypothetical protein
MNILSKAKLLKELEFIQVRVLTNSILSLAKAIILQQKQNMKRIGRYETL